MLRRCSKYALVPFALVPVAVRAPSQAPFQEQQMRAILDGEHQLQAEIDGAEAVQAALLISDRDDVGDAGLLTALATLPMVRVDALRWRASVDLRALEPGQRLFAQAVSVDGAGHGAASPVAALHNGERGLGGAIGRGVYEGPRLSVTLAGISRVPPYPGSYGVQLGMLAPSNDWALSYHLAVQRPSGTDLLVVVKRPGEGEGELDLTERHGLFVDLGSLPLSELRVLVALTPKLRPAAATLVFRPQSTATDR